MFNKSSLLKAYKKYFLTVLSLYVILLQIKEENCAKLLNDNMVITVKLSTYDKGHLVIIINFKVNTVCIRIIDKLRS